MSRSPEANGRKKKKKVYQNDFILVSPSPPFFFRSSGGGKKKEKRKTSSRSVVLYPPLCHGRAKKRGEGKKRGVESYGGTAVCSSFVRALPERGGKKKKSHL